MKLELEVTDCRDCPMNIKRIEKGGMIMWHECVYFKRDLYFSGIQKNKYNFMTHGSPETFEEIPRWCPLLKKELGK